MIRRAVFLFLFFVLLSGASATATFAQDPAPAPGASTAAPGCDSGLLEAMKTRSEAARVADNAYNRTLARPDVSMALTCFDLGLALSARLGSVFSDLAGGINLQIPSAWADIAGHAVVKVGKATPKFFPPDRVEPPLGKLMNGVLGAINLFGHTGMTLYNPLAGLGGLRLEPKAPFFDWNSLLHIYWKAFQLDLNNYLPNFKGSIGADLGLNVAEVLDGLIAALNVNFPQFPLVNGFPALPDLNFDFQFALCGLGAAAALGVDLEPLLTILAHATIILDKVNKVITVVNAWLGFMQEIVNAFQLALTDLMATANLLSSFRASLAGIDWPSFLLPLPAVSPGCLGMAAMWLGKQIVKHVKDGKLDSADLVDIGKQGAIGMMKDLPFFSYNEMIDGALAAGEEAGDDPLTADGQSGPPVAATRPDYSTSESDPKTTAGSDGTVKIPGELKALKNVKIIKKASNQVNSVLAKARDFLHPEEDEPLPDDVKPIDSWKKPVQGAATDKACDVIARMPGPQIGTCK